MLRRARASDATELAQIYYAAVRDGPSLYSQAQRVAWAPQRPDGQQWEEKLSALTVVVAQADDGLAGFMAVAPGGYIDLAFVHPDHQGKGVFGRLYDWVETWAEDHDEPLLWTHASLMAQPAFQAMGFLVIHHETVVRDGQELQRAKMEKRLK